MSRKWEWIGDPADILTGFTGDGGQQYGAHLLEFPERKVRELFSFSVFLVLLTARFFAGLNLEVSQGRVKKKKKKEVIE